MALSQISIDGIMAALGTVQDPTLKKDLVSLDAIKDVKLGSDGVISLRVVLANPGNPFKAQIQSEVEKALRRVPGVTGVKITMDAQASAKKNSTEIEGVSHIIAVSSGKGGVGKSTVAVNLATALALDGFRVGLMDADVYGPNVPTMMGATEQPEIVQDPVRGEMFIPPSSHGVKVISMGFLIQGDQPLVWRGPMLHSVVNQFCHKVNWGKLDYLIVDMPPGTGDVQLSLAQLVPISGAVLVTTPQEVSMQDVRKAYHMFEKVRVPIFGFVENMSYFTCDSCEKKHYLFGSEGGKMLSKKYGIDLLSQLPIVPSVREGGDIGRPIVIGEPKSDVAKSFRELAKKLVQKAAIAVSQSPTDPSQSIHIGKF